MDLTYDKLEVTEIDGLITSDLWDYDFLDKYSELMEKKKSKVVLQSLEYRVMLDDAESIMLDMENRGLDISKYKTPLQYMGIED